MKKCILAILFMFSHVAAIAQIYNPCDKKATFETFWLYSSLQRLAGSEVMFGHHDDLAYGVGWRGQAARSDVKSVTGLYPALYGWDLARAEQDSSQDINGIPFKRQHEFVRQVYERGGINAFCWHMRNPANGKTAWDTSQNTVKEIIPGGSHHKDYLKYLDRVAHYFKKLKGDEGEPIPVIFRPFHELTGNWFWWGKNTCTPDEFKSLWRFTIGYLRNDKKVHNLLIAYSVGDFSTEAEFMERYPGDDVVDIVGFDSYCYKSVANYQRNLDKQLAITQAVAQAHHKPFAIAETGYEGIPQADWWTSVLLPVISKYKLSYVMVWRNGSDTHFYAPYPGQVSEADFKAFAKSKKTMFQEQITGLSVYGKHLAQ